VPRPRGGDWLQRDLQLMRKEGIDGLVSMLTNEEAADFDLLHEEEESRQIGIEYESCPTPDRSIPPEPASFARLAHKLAAKLELGQSIGIHCRQGIGRSSLMAAAVLTSLGMKPGEALRAVSKARGIKVPETVEQARWFEDYARTHHAVGAK